MRLSYSLPTVDTRKKYPMETEIVRPISVHEARAALTTTKGQK